VKIVLHSLQYRPISSVNYMSCTLGESCMDIKTEADSNEVSECPHDDKPTIGMLGFSDIPI